MSADDNSSADSADIGDALVAALGFEPTDGRKVGRKAAAADSAVTESSIDLDLDNGTDGVNADAEILDDGLSVVSPDNEAGPVVETLSSDSKSLSSDSKTDSDTKTTSGNKSNGSNKNGSKNSKRSQKQQNNSNSNSSKASASDKVSDEEEIKAETKTTDTKPKPSENESPETESSETEVSDAASVGTESSETQNLDTENIESDSAEQDATETSPEDSDQAVDSEASGEAMETVDLETLLGSDDDLPDASVNPAVTGDLTEVMAATISSPPPPSAADVIKLDKPAGGLAQRVGDGEAPTSPPGKDSTKDSKKSSAGAHDLKPGDSGAKDFLADPQPAPQSSQAESAATARLAEPVVAEVDLPGVAAPPATPVTADPSPAAQVEVARSESLTKPVTERVVTPATDPARPNNPFRRKRKVQARKVRRVVRHIDPWSVLTFSVLFHLAVFAALLLASVLVWNAAESAGTIENIETFILDLGDFEEFEIQGDVVFRAAVAIAGVLTLASSVLLVLLTVVFNLISDLVGGIRLTVIEEETVRVRRRKKG